MHTNATDVDNLVKFVLDSINKVAYLDDGQVSVLTAAKVYTQDRPRVEVQIRKLGNEDKMFADNFGALSPSP